MSALTEALAGLAAGRDLTAAEVHAAVSTIMAGNAPDAVIAAFLTALRMKGESAEEVAGPSRRSASVPRPGSMSDSPRRCSTPAGRGATAPTRSTSRRPRPSSSPRAASRSPSTATAPRRGTRGAPRSSPSWGSPSRPNLTPCGAAWPSWASPSCWPHPVPPGPAVRRPRPPAVAVPDALQPARAAGQPRRSRVPLVGVAGERQADLMAEALVRLGARSRRS